MRSHVRKESERQSRAENDGGEAGSRAVSRKRAAVATKVYAKQLSKGELSQKRLEEAFRAGIQAYDWALKQ